MPARCPLPPPPALVAPRMVPSARPCPPCCLFPQGSVPFSQAPSPGVLQPAEPSHPPSLLLRSIRERALHLLPFHETNSSKEGNSIFSKQRVGTPRAYWGTNLPRRFHKSQSVCFLCHQWRFPAPVVCCRLLGLLFNICAATTQQFLVAPTCSVFPLNSVPQRCPVKTLLMALPCLLSGKLVALPARWRWSSSYDPSGGGPSAP